MRRVPTLLTLLVSVACAPEAPREDGAAAEATADAPQAPIEREVSSSLALATAAQEAEPLDFPHDEHRSLGCQRCHAAPRGHEGHADLGCLECHLMPYDAEESAPATDPGRCASCHHGQARADCRACHAEAPAETMLGQARAAPRSPEGVQLAGTNRVLPFDHARHEAFACAQCHSEPPALDARGSCEGCHDRHHQPTAGCTVCHSDVPREPHGASVHTGCGGTGCHTDATVLALAASRELCLLCHADRAEHEPGGRCEVCHLTRIGPASMGGRP